MEIGMIGLGRMGGNMTRRLLQGGHRVVVFDRSTEAVQAAEDEGAAGAGSLAELVQALQPPRAVWMMVPAGAPVEATIAELSPLMSSGDVLIDGGNSNYKDTIHRAEALVPAGIRYVDAGTSGGIWGLKEGYCLMVGGAPEAYALIEPALKTLAPEHGCLHVGPSGAGHFTKMVHNGIEYGMLQAFGEGFEILRNSRFDLDLHAISELWRHGSVVRSWLLDLLERALAQDATLEGVRGYVEDSGEGRWTVFEAIDQNTPAPVLTLSLLARFASRQEESFSAQVIAALRREFGGHAIRASES
ncbi:MAG: phosphogluconate dehydrogenase (NAD(+)-dependent, decarboxylating) [Dehalococcoidia bacterium]